MTRPAFYALESGGLRDYVTLLHLPYTAWHLSYVVIGASLAADFAGGRLLAALASFFLALGIGAHALDEVNGRPLGTRIPARMLVALAVVSIVGAGAIGVAGAVVFRAWLALLVPVGVFLVLAYNLELGRGWFHSDVWFGLAWGGFPVLNGYAAVAGNLSAVAVLAAAFAVLLSLAQRALSTHVRFVRRRVVEVRGELALADGDTRRLDARSLTRSTEAGLRLLSLATVVLAATLVAFRI